MDRRQAESLTKLARLAAMKREAELSKLAAVARSRARLQQAVTALRAQEAPLDPEGGSNEPAMIRARLMHRKWSDAQLRRLNQQLALVTADWLRQKPAAAKAFGRADVLEKLAGEAAQEIRARKP